MKIKTKLILGFGILLVLMFALAGTGINRLTSTVSDINEIYENRYQKVKLSTQTRSDTAELSRALANLLMIDTPDMEKKQIELIRATSERVSGELQKIQNLFQENKEKQLAADVTENGRSFLEFKDQLLRLYLDGKRAEANNLRTTVGNGLQDTFMASVASMSKYEEEAMDTAISQSLIGNKQSLTYTWLLTIAGLLVGLITMFWIVISLTRGLSGLSLLINNFANGRWGNNNYRYPVRSSDEFGQLGTIFNRLADDLQETREKEKALNQINEDTIWLQAKSANLWYLMQELESIEEVCDTFIGELARVIGAQCGAVYLIDDTMLEKKLLLKGAYAQSGLDPVPQIQIGEGLVGQCAKDRKPVRIEADSGKYAKIRSAFGEIDPIMVTVQPVLYNNEVLGVFELASLKKLNDLEQKLLDQMSEIFGILLSSLQNRLRNLELLRVHQALTDELQSQSEELLSQQDELKASNEKLEEQTKVLQASEELLQRQQEELEQANEALMRKTAELEVQIRETEESNNQIKLAKEALEKQAIDLAVASKYKSEFLANMSHELRTPLNSLLILSQLLKENKDGNLTEKQVEYADTIYSSGSDLLKLIDDVLDLAKVEAGRMVIHHERVSVPEIAESLRKSFRHLAHSRELEFAVQVEETVPSHIETDGKRLQQILNNLLSNAFKFTHHGSVRLEIRYLSRPVPTIGFAVEDTGIGVSEEKQQLIFEAFQQADGTTSRKYGGTGLGLSISRQLAGLLGGTIELESELGSGSTFTLLLPLSMVSAVREAAAAAVPLPAAAKPGTAAAGASFPSSESAEFSDDRDTIAEGDKVLLIIEDDANFAAILLDMARSREFKAVVALQGDTGLELASKLQPDAILLDIQLPVMDGWSVLMKLKNDTATRHIPIHVISVTDEILQGLSMGAIAWLRKPASKDHLEKAFAHIQSFLSREIRDVLIVQQDDAHHRSFIELIDHDDVNIAAAAGGREALELLSEQTFDCMVLDYALEDMPIYELLDRIKADQRLRRIPIILYTGTTLEKNEQLRLKKYAESIIIKDVKSPERLLDETSLFLHRIEERLPEEKRQLLQKVHSVETVFAGRKALLVDDDIRNVFALANLLEGLDMQVAFAETGRQALELLQREPDFDLVLMDIMMPEMDGYEAMRAIRAEERFEKLPIIALTAKAMKEDRDKCIQAGASDYITKPIHTEQLLSLMRVWLCK